MPRPKLPRYGYDEKNRPIHEYNKAGHPVCGAVYSTGRVCQSRDRQQNGRCPLHSGKIKAGPENHRFRHGLYSKIVPKTLQDVFDTALNNPRILRTEEDVALLDMRIVELLRQVYNADEEVYEPPTAEELQVLAEEKSDEEAFNIDDFIGANNFRKITTLLQDARKQVKDLEIEHDVPREASSALRATFRKICEQIEDGRNKQQAWDEIRETNLLKSKLIKQQNEEIRNESKSIPAQVVYAVFTAMMAEVAKFIPSRNDKILLGQAIDRIIKSKIVFEVNSHRGTADVLVDKPVLSESSAEYDVQLIPKDVERVIKGKTPKHDVLTDSDIKEVLDELEI